MSLLNGLNDHSLWMSYLERKKEKGHVPDRILKKYESFIENREYEELANGIISETYEFSIPVKKMINKGRTGKKRAVYTFTDEETMMLRMIAFLLYDHDDLFAPELYSFRRNGGVKKALDKIVNTPGIDLKYGYKTDISNYFNSIDPDILVERLKGSIDDEKLIRFFEKILKDPRAMFNDEMIEEQKGIMAGIPVSAFLANFYLKDMDLYFHEKNVTYARYADDIILFADTEEELREYRDKICEFMDSGHLSMNPEKEIVYAPGDEFEFLGFSYRQGTIDLSRNTVIKIKAKIRRSARSIRRWMLRNDVQYEKALFVMNRKYNRKFYGKNEKELTWKYWFFATINTDESLKEVDRYMQEAQRYIVTGKHNKKNYEKVPYETLKECGYRSLVHEYYSDREESMVSENE